MILILGVGLRMLGPSSCCQPSLQFPKSPLRTLWSLKFLIHNPSFYSFPVVPGRMLVRLRFYSNLYNRLNTTNAVFSVTACNRLNATNDKFFFLFGSFTLLRNFNTAQTTEVLNYVYIVNEYLIAVNGLGIISLWGKIRVPVTTDPSKTIITYPKDMSTYVAPKNVYSIARSMGSNPQINQNYNLTWIFRVNRTFNIFLGNEIAEFGANAIRWAKHNGVPMYKDYAVIVPGEGPQQDLWLALHPDLSTQFEYDDAILNGVEIFKQSDIDCNLVGANPISGPQHVIDLSKALPSIRAGNSNKQKAIIDEGVDGGMNSSIYLQNRHQPINFFITSSPSQPTNTKFKSILRTKQQIK
ncbi:hypothetical protein Q3G72_025651 [Acer saccharum]|nr:hypothetical protein Q3G72_025651 [Acer saccharum]